MLGLGSSIIDTSTRLWHPTDVSSLEMWLVARQEYLTLDGTAIDAWTAKYGKAAAYNYTQSTDAQRPTWDAANQKVVTDGSNDNLQEGSNTITLDTSATGWTIAVYCTSSDWDGANQVFLGDNAGNNDFFRHDNAAQTLSIKNDGQTRTVTLDTPSALVNDQFYHIMATVQTNGDFVVYIDNVAQTDTESFTNTKDLEIDQIIGKYGASQTLDGAIKSIMIFREPLGAEDRKGCYEHMTQR